jgi:hypothetical protein
LTSCHFDDILVSATGLSLRLLVSKNQAMKLSATTLLLAAAQFVFCQNNPANIEGRVLDKNSQPIPYANIFNLSLKKGTISNHDGYFRMEASGKTTGDTLVISFVGFETKQLVVRAGTGFKTVILEESAQLLTEVVVTPKLNAYLYNLLAECKKRPSKAKVSGKAYHELKTFHDSTQVELVENFHNVQVNGYDLYDLDVKVGRLALQPFGNRYFASLESSTAIARSRLLGENPDYPSSPFSLTKRQMQKKFYLHLEKKYLDEQGDSIYVIDFEPVSSNGKFFEGTVWINKSQSGILKINLHCNDCRIYPFRPIFSSDSIVGVGFNITKTFQQTGAGMALNHVDFTYTSQYRSRIGTDHEKAYAVKTNAVLYVYSLGQQFDLPIFEVSPTVLKGHDYRSISARPYNDFFWKNNDEYRLNERKNGNEQFFDDPNSLTNKTAFKRNPKIRGSGLFEHPFVFWSTDRVKFREVVEDTTQAFNTQNPGHGPYNLSVKTFVDINTYQGITDIQTATIFDPFESYFHLPMDSKALCFINLFFDVCEIERRHLEASLKAVSNDPDKARALAKQGLKNIELKKREFEQSVKRGTNEEEMLRWNSFVLAELGIDNLAIFKPFEKKTKDEDGQ